MRRRWLLSWENDGKGEGEDGDKEKMVTRRVVPLLTCLLLN